MKGAESLLQALQDAGWSVALATSTSRKTTMHHLELSGFTRYFSVIVTGDEIQHGKPNPDFYLPACKKLFFLPDPPGGGGGGAGGRRFAGTAARDTITASYDKIKYNSPDCLPCIGVNCRGELFDCKKRLPITWQPLFWFILLCAYKQIRM